MDADAPSCSDSNAGMCPLQWTGHVLRKWQRGVEQVISKAQQAGAQLQLGAVENLQHFSDALSHPTLINIRRRRARPTMLCCLSGAAGGAASGPSVRLPRAPDLTSNLSLTKDPAEQGQPGIDTAGSGTEEPILISEVGNDFWSSCQLFWPTM